MMDTDAIEKLIGRMYTSFITRDLTFFVSGGLVIAVALNAPVIDTFASVISRNIDFFWLAIPAYLALSYVVGILLQEITLILLEHIPNKVKKIKTEPLIVSMEKIQHHCSSQTILGLERILFLKQIGATQSITLLVMGVIVLVRNFSSPPIDILAMLVVGVGLCVWLFYRMSSMQAEIISALEELAPASAKSNKKN